MTNSLKSLIKNIDSQNKTRTFIFDLDSTIFCVSPRTEHILKMFGQKSDIQAEFPNISGQLNSIQSSQNDWGILTMLNRNNVVFTLDFFEKARNFWIQEFFSSRHIHLDNPYPGAVEFVKKIASLGVEVRYLTGRDEVRMKQGTLKQIKAHGLPLADPSFLHMKPDESWLDVEYKMDLLSRLNGNLRDYYYFENEPVIINQALLRFPELNIIFADTVHSGREEAPINLPRVGFEWLF